MTRHVVITGLGAVTPVGLGADAFWRALREGRTGVGPLTAFDARAYDCQVAAEIADFKAGDFMGAKLAATLPRFAQFGVSAARLAYEDAGMASVTPVRVGACFGTSTGAVREFAGAITQEVKEGGGISPTVVLQSIASTLTQHVAVELRITGPIMTLASGCSSALDAVEWGVEQIRSGQAIAVVAGGSDSPLSESIHATWSALGLLSRWPGPIPQSLRPFDALSDGTVLGEGAAAFVLEELGHARTRGARVYGEVLGYGAGSEGLHYKGNGETAISLERAAVRALRAARVAPSEIDHVGAHGGGVPANDRAETAALRRVFGRHAYSMPVTSIKPTTGNSFSAGGALQVVAGCRMLEEQFVPATLNLDIPDVQCDLDYVPSHGRSVRLNRLLIAARALGPTYSALVLARPSLA